MFFCCMALLITAHPDDECMFFSPTMPLIAHCLCLSNGNQDGLGAVREKELHASCQVLGISYTIGNLQDGHVWSRDQVMAHAMPLLKQYKEVYTFDEYGVSGHMNHIAIYDALKASNIRFHALESVSLWRKYIGVWDMLLAADSVVTTSVAGYRAMLCHWSQLVWFRWLYLLFSRYMWVNTYVVVNKGSLYSFCSGRIGDRMDSTSLSKFLFVLDRCLFGISMLVGVKVLRRRGRVSLRYSFISVPCCAVIQ